MILFAKGLREVVSHPRIDTVLVLSTDRSLLALTGVSYIFREIRKFKRGIHDRGNRNNPAQSSRILGIRIDNSVT